MKMRISDWTERRHEMTMNDGVIISLRLFKWLHEYLTDEVLQALDEI